MTEALSLFEKIWRRHTILEREDGAVLLHVGRHLVHDGTAAAFRSLADRGLVNPCARLCRGRRTAAPGEGRSDGMVSLIVDLLQLLIFVLIAYSLLSWYLAYARVSYDSPAFKVRRSLSRNTFARASCTSSAVGGLPRWIRMLV